MSEQPTTTKTRPGDTIISCADCGQPMVVRTQRETGHEFLGCSTWPQCEHTEPLPEWFRLKRAGAAMLPGLEA